MLTIACVAGLLIFNTTAFNPDQIISVKLYKDNIIVAFPSKDMYRTYEIGADSEKERKEAWEYSLEAWRECLSDNPISPNQRTPSTGITRYNK